MRNLLNVFGGRRRRLERDLERELGSHLDSRTDELVRGGVDRTQARKRAMLELGGPAQVQEEVRDAWISRWLGDRARDLRFSARGLMRRPAFTSTAVLSIAIGIGASAAIFSLVDQLLLRTLPVRDPGRLVLLNWSGSSLAPGLGSGNVLSSRLCRQLQQRDVFEGVFCRHPREVALAVGGQTELVLAEVVTGSYFPVLGVQPALGRLLDPSDDVQPGAHPVAVLSYDYWRNRLSGRADVVGQAVMVNGFPMTVAGVAPQSFWGVDPGEVPDIWVPEAMKLQVLPSWTDILDNPRARWLHVFARLKPGSTADAVTSTLQPWFEQFKRDDMSVEGFPVASVDQRDRYLASALLLTDAAGGRSNLRDALDRPLLVLLAGTALLHLLASLNVASLFLARGAARIREIQMRLALGSSRGRVAALLATDGLLVAAAGAGAGLLVAPVVLHAALSFLPQETAGTALAAHLDLRVFGFAAAASVVTTLLCGAALLWQANRVSLVTSLRQRGMAGGSVGLRKALVAGQIAFTLVLLVGSGLFVQTLARLEAKGPGFSTASVVTFAIDPRQSGYSDDDAARLVREILVSLQSHPAVRDAAIAGFDLLGGGSWNGDMTIERDDRITTDRDVDFNIVSANFFDLMDVRVVAGRGFEPRDAYAPGESGPFRSVVVNESFARRYFGDDTPVGRRVGIGGGPDTVTDIEIVGIVSDFAYRDMRDQSEQAYFPYLEGGGESGTFYVAMENAAATGFAEVRDAVNRVDPTLPLQSLRTLDDQMDRSLMTERMLAALSGSFGTIALLLAIVGLYGVLSFVVTTRTREIGIRLALGATHLSALWHVVGDALVLIAIGTGAALPCVWAVGRLVEAQLYGVAPLDIPTIAVATAVLTLAAFAGTVVPAWRAASVKPTQALRSE